MSGRDAHALVLLDWVRPEEGILTAKLFEYLNARAPILATGPDSGSGVAGILERTGRGLHLGRSVAAVRGALTGLLTGELGRRLEPRPEAVARFSRRAQADAYLALIEERVDAGTAGGGRPAR